ncbi:hypothetical protein SAMN02745163_03730 [Clostridium cavendishii DSM 21758]|uniref:DUF5651 domain-containing protein n=1 Tax=Clostridium cavendishii DSM 21758 TaxID=1121302 RepID=A0A1M6S1Z5_9CLOT|nr:DUF5651 domain-containing protein [Clostridium cavendishii]SHK38725.1 hypothetical protein SAMN02745163_03730 [Clostridium cavendishii DSM 21758]
MKDYLNTAERENLIRIVHLSSDIETCLEGNVLNKQEIGNLRRARTFAMKTVESVLSRVNETSAKTFRRTATSSKMTLDIYGDREINFKKKVAEYSAKYDENKEYYKLVELIFDNCCKNCKCDGFTCDIYKEFENQCIYEFDGTDKSTNCRYSYKG